METEKHLADTTESRKERARRNRHIILAIVFTGIFMCVIDVQVVAIALPTITHLLGEPIGQTQWIATSYVLVILSTVLLLGTVSGAYGRGRVFKAGLAIFTAASLACGLSTTLPFLILFRVLQAVGASLMMSVMMALILEVCPPEERGRAMGINTAVIALGLIIGPSAGGFIVEAAGWPYIFLVNVPVGVLLLAGSAKYLDYDPPAAPHGFSDWPGAALLIILMASIAIALSILANPPVQAGYFAAWGLIACAALVLFVLRERSAARPLMDLGVFRIRGFVLPSISLILYFTATFLLLTGQPFYFQGVMGLSPTHIGIIALITPVTMILCAPLFGWMYDHIPWKGYTLSGLALMGISFFGCAIAFARVDFLLIVAGFILAGLARSIFQGPNVIEIMAALPPSQHGLGSGLFTTLMYLGVTVGISLTTIILTDGLAASGYSGQVLDAGPGLLAPVFGQMMIVGGILCLAGAACSYRK